MPGLSAKDLVVWGWLPLLLGAAQVGLSVAAVFALFAVGLAPETWVLVGAAMLATCASRILYDARTPRARAAAYRS